MAKTFEDLHGQVHILHEDYDISTDVHEDIETGEVTKYIVEINEVQIEVRQSTYTAVTNYLDSL